MRVIPVILGCTSTQLQIADIQWWEALGRLNHPLSPKPATFVRAGWRWTASRMRPTCQHSCPHGPQARKAAGTSNLLPSVYSPAHFQRATSKRRRFVASIRMEATRGSRQRSRRLPSRLGTMDAGLSTPPPRPEAVSSCTTERSRCWTTSVFPPPALCFTWGHLWRQNQQ